VYHIFSFADHSNSLIPFKPATYYALSDDELDEIVSCKDKPLMKAYMLGWFLAACSLLKHVMPGDAKAVFQTEVFHPATVSPKLQPHDDPYLVHSTLLTSMVTCYMQ
jgi:hypothetical protein